MIKVIIKIPVLSNYVDHFIILASQLAELARKEPGCIDYSVVRSQNDRSVVFLMESWDSGKSLQNHLEKPYYSELTEKTGKLQSGPPDIHVCDLVD